MKKFKILFLLMSLALPLQVLVAQPKGYVILKDSVAFKDAFQKKSKSITTNQADFTQEKYIAIMTENIKSNGKFYLKNKTMMRWETSSPADHIIVLNNGKMSIKEKGKVKTYDTNSNKMFKGLNDLMLTTANGDMLTSKEYFHKLYENSTYFLTILEPINKLSKKYIETIEVYVEKSDLTVSEIKMVEPSGDYTKINFKNKKINTLVNNDLFILK